MPKECLSHGYLAGEQKRNKKCTLLSSTPYSTCYLFCKCYAHTLFYALCSLLSFLPTSWLSLFTLFTQPGSFTSAQASVFKFWVSLHPKLSTWDTYLFNIKLKKVIFLSNSDCHLINIDFFFSLYPWWPHYFMNPWRNKTFSAAPCPIYTQNHGDPAGAISRASLS